MKIKKGYDGLEAFFDILETLFLTS